MKVLVLALAALGVIGGCSSSSSSSPSSDGTPECTSADGTTCPTGAGALQLCTTSSNGTCMAAYFQVGSLTFQCNSCMDTTACEDQAAAACYGDAGSGSSGSSGGGSSSGSSSGAQDAAGQ